MKRIELSTSSLPRKCSTPELQRLVKSRDLPYTSLSGRRGSNPRPTAWKAVALPTELLPLVNSSRSTPSNALSSHRLLQNTVGKDGFEPPNSEEDRFTVCCRWPLGYLPILCQSQRRDSNPRPADYKSAALPTELLWLVTLPPFSHRADPLAPTSHHTDPLLFLGRQR